MSDDPEKDENNEEQSFADLFEAYSNGMNEDIQLGDKLSGKIIHIGRENVFVDVGARIDGVVEKDELLNEDLELTYKQGDSLELYVVLYSGNELRLSKSLSGIGNQWVLEDAFRKSVPVEGKVKAECKGGFHVDVMGKRAFCPVSQMDITYVESPNEYVGETFPFFITQFDEGGRNIVVSRRKLLEKEQQKTRKAFFEGIAVDAHLEGRVTKLMPYGAFVEIIPGVEGMVHVSEMSWSRVAKPEDVLRVGDKVAVKVIAMEAGKQPQEIKLALSMKQVSEDPWNTVSQKFSMGDKITGIVTRCAKFGAFVEIAPGVEGLVHISEISYKKRILRTEDAVAPGDAVEVMIKEIDTENRRVSLSMKDAKGDPWIDIDKKYRAGQSVTGVIEKKARFGYFVTLEPGITGLLPKSKIGALPKPSEVERLGLDDPIQVIIEKINPNERKISLAPGSKTDDADWKTYSTDSKKPMGSLGEKLQQALKSKNRA